MRQKIVSDVYYKNLLFEFRFYLILKKYAVYLSQHAKLKRWSNNCIGNEGYVIQRKVSARFLKSCNCIAKEIMNWDIKLTDHFGEQIEMCEWVHSNMSLGKIN